MSRFLEQSDIINFYHPIIKQKIDEIVGIAAADEERARLAFQFVRDVIQHSFDLKSKTVTITASETLEKGEGICFAKAHLLAALLRGMGIPAGFCYQRVTRLGTPDSGYALHGLNAVYLAGRDNWFRVDPRGNKPGVKSEFSIETEQLAYPIRGELGEVDYLEVYPTPLDPVIKTMKEARDCDELFYMRPEKI
nr:transglutaminase family protein [Ammoniphilus resinae]